MHTSDALMTLAELAEIGANTPAERLAFHDACAVAFLETCPFRAAAARSAADALRAANESLRTADEAQLKFRELLRAVPIESNKTEAAR